MAAVAPSSSDARVPCPACGTLIHPVAGRCKHCKQDLAQYRASRPAANAALPALAPRATPVAGTPAKISTDAAHVVSTPTAATIVPDHVAPVAPKIASPFPTGDVERPYDPTRPVLPPRATAGHGVVKKESWISRNWPIVVIVLASAAIIGAVVLMMLPPSEAGAGKKKGAGAPAPERMNTDQLPETKPDPWGGASPTPPAPRAAPDPVPDPNAPLPDLKDPFAQQNPTPDPSDPLSNMPFDPSQLSQGMPSGAGVAFAMIGKICDKAKACSGSDPTMQQVCSGLAAMPRQSVPQNCTAAQECMDSIEHMDVCGSMANNLDPMSLMQTTSSCMKAITSC